MDTDYSRSLPRDGWTESHSSLLPSPFSNGGDPRKQSFSVDPPNVVTETICSFVCFEHNKKRVTIFILTNIIFDVHSFFFNFSGCWGGGFCWSPGYLRERRSKDPLYINDTQTHVGTRKYWSKKVNCYIEVVEKGTRVPFLQSPQSLRIDPIVSSTQNQ